eukprot:scaffold7328_cov314-Pinguiococcus_pyrenoidosus.AAC.44
MIQRQQGSESLRSLHSAGFPRERDSFALFPPFESNGLPLAPPRGLELPERCARRGRGHLGCHAGAHGLHQLRQSLESRAERAVATGVRSTDRAFPLGDSCRVVRT